MPAAPLLFKNRQLDPKHSTARTKQTAIDEEVTMDTLGCILKYQEDIGKFKDEIWADREQRTAYLER